MQPRLVELRLARSVLVAALLFASRAAGAPTYVVTDLGTLGGPTSAAWGINGAGQVAGSASTADGAQHAFLYSGGVMLDLGTLGGSTSLAFGVNDAGQVVGAAATAGNLASHAFLYSRGIMTDLGTLGGQTSVGQAINAAGQVTGSAEIGTHMLHAFLFSGGVMSDVGTFGGTASFGYGINRAGDVVGAAYDAGSAPRAHAFLYHGAAITDLGTLGGQSSSARGINDSSDVAGVAEDAANTPHAFRYRGGVMTDLGTLDGSASFAYGIDGAGDVVGWVADEDGARRAFIFADGVMTDLNTLIPAGSGWVVHEARAINDARQVAAIGAVSGPEHALLLTASAPVTTTSTTTSSSTSVTTTSTTSTTTTEPATTTSTTTAATTTTSTTVAPSSLHVTDCRAAPGGTALCEVELISGAGVEVATLQFNATVEPVASTPALLGPVGFAQDPDLPAPSLIQPEGASTVLVGWLSPINPHLTGTRAIGRMSVPVPAGAQVGQSYRLRIVAPSATSDGSSDIPITAGPDGTLGVERTFVVCDVAPPGTDRNGDGDAFDAGEFGNGEINNADVAAVFRASLLPDQRPPADSDLFSAMDAAPEDVPPACGGNAAIVNSDVVACFRRSLLPLPRSERTRGAGLCTSAPSAAASSPPAARPAGLLVARRGSPATSGRIVTLPVRLHLVAGARLATLQFAAAVSPQGTAPPPTDGPRFEPAPRYPPPDIALVEGGRLLLGWLRPWPATRRRTVRLGRLRWRLPDTVLAGDRYTVSVADASGTAPGGEELRLDGGSVRLKAGRRR